MNWMEGQLPQLFRGIWGAEKPSSELSDPEPRAGHCVGTNLFFTSEGLPFMTGGWDGGHPKTHPGLCTRAALSGRSRGAGGRWQGYKSQKAL